VHLACNQCILVNVGWSTSRGYSASASVSGNPRSATITNRACKPTDCYTGLCRLWTRSICSIFYALSHECHDLCLRFQFITVRIVAVPHFLPLRHVREVIHRSRCVYTIPSFEVGILLSAIFLPLHPPQTYSRHVGGKGASDWK